MPPPLIEAAAFGISWRAMTDGDLPFVAALFATTRAHLVQPGWPRAMQAAFLEQQHRMQHLHFRGAWPDAEWLLIERGGAPIGRLYLAEQDGHLLIVDISLLPEARGAGLGTAILKDVLAGEARPVELTVEPFNPARRLYDRLGFEAVEESAAYVRMIRAPTP